MDLANYIPGAGMLAIAVTMLGWLVTNYGKTIRRLEREAEATRKTMARQDLSNRVCNWRQSQLVIWMHQRGDPVPDFMFIPPEWAEKERRELDEA